jgi:hypothetical protein
MVRAAQRVSLLRRLMSYFRYHHQCSDIVLPESIWRCKVAVDEWVERSRPRHTAKLCPFFSQCSVELNWNRKKVSITCDAVVATILSLFETPGTLVRQSEIETKTGVKGELFSAVMEQLCMKRPKDGMATGLLQVQRSFVCIECVSTHAPCFDQANKDEDVAYRFHPK